MNERMRELAIDAGGHGLKMSTIGLSLLGEKQIEKFAELIVKECLDFLEKDAADAPDNSDVQAALLACALDILDHFDIELDE